MQTYWMSLLSACMYTVILEVFSAILCILLVLLLYKYFVSLELTLNCNLYPITYFVGTSQPNVTLSSRSLSSLSITWSVPSTDYITRFTVYWSGLSLEIYPAIFMGNNSTRHSVHNLVSNTPYNVTVEAIGPLGSLNSTREQFFTPPKGINIIIMVFPD